jgi:hypothetical protein
MSCTGSARTPLQRPSPSTRSVSVHMCSVNMQLCEWATPSRSSTAYCTCTLSMGCCAGAALCDRGITAVRRQRGAVLAGAAVPVGRVRGAVQRALGRGRAQEAAAGTVLRGVQGAPQLLSVLCAELPLPDKSVDIALGRCRHGTGAAAGAATCCDRCA